MIRNRPASGTRRNGPLANRAIRTFLADGSPFMLASLGRTLAKNDRIILVGSATDGQKAIRSASTLHLDLAVLDLHMPGLDGAEATRLLKEFPNPPTIFVVSSDDSFAARTRCLAFGADAFIATSMDLAAELHTAIKNFFSDDLAENKGQSDPYATHQNTLNRRIPVLVPSV